MNAYQNPKIAKVLDACRDFTERGWTCEVLGVYRCQECRTEYTYTGARMLDCPYCAGSPEYEAALRMIAAGGGAS